MSMVAVRSLRARPGVMLALVAALSLAACGGGKTPSASQTAAKVNKEEITVHQINQVLQRQQVSQDQLDAASRQVLERLIDQELAVQKAQELKLDRDPAVVQQIEAAKREIIAGAYAKRIGESASKPSDEDIKAYYEANPALFSERRIYNLQELTIEAKPEQLPAIRQHLNDAKTLNEFVEYLRSQNIRFGGNQVVRAAEQLPLQSVTAVARMKDGDSMVNDTRNGLQALYLVGSRSEPVSMEAAKPLIEQFLMNQRRTEAIQKDVKAMRDAAKIEYIGKFAEPAASAPLAASAPAAQPSGPALPQPVTPSAPTGGLTAEDIQKGLKLK